jgi:pSer/pThr/pTyr-binding forkhead associated (FHA) protein
MPVAAPASLILSDGTEQSLDTYFTVGRADDCDLRLETTTVSRQHALITSAEDRWFVEDRGSFNGTLLNGSRIQPGVRLPLRHGDRIGLGTETLVFSCPAELDDPEKTTPLAEAPPALTRPLSPFQQQVVRALCEAWLSGGSLDELPSNEEIAARLGTPGATETVKAALRRAYAKAGLTSGSPYAKRRTLCKIARQRGWV